MNRKPYRSQVHAPVNDWWPRPSRDDVRNALMLCAVLLGIVGYGLR